MSDPWFIGDKAGLERIARRRGLSYVLFELVQNAWDTGATDVKVTFTPCPGRPFVIVRVEDNDPDGFPDLTHAWTLFAESAKKSDPTKRGRFNLGEKLVLAICEDATITTTKGTVYFSALGRRTSRVRREFGTLFEGTIRMTRDELAEVKDAARLLICPGSVGTTIDGAWLMARHHVAVTEATLRTEVADESGFLRSVLRKTHVRVFERLPGEPGRIYEMGIPVCETGDPWDVEIGQKVPVSLDRNSVTTSYLRAVRVVAANAMRDRIRADEVTSEAVQQAIAQPDADPEMIRHVLVQQFGPKFVITDPSDREAENRCKEEGFTIIPSRGLQPGAWDNIRQHGLAIPAGRMRPTYKPYSEDGAQATFLPADKWDPYMRDTADYATMLARRLMGIDLEVRFETGRAIAPFLANYGDRCLTFNLDRLGRSWFYESSAETIDDLLLHEFGHQYASNHLSAEYHKALTMLGARLKGLALSNPELFKPCP